MCCVVLFGDVLTSAGSELSARLGPDLQVFTQDVTLICRAAHKKDATLRDKRLLYLTLRDKQLCHHAAGLLPVGGAWVCLPYDNMGGQLPCRILTSCFWPAAGQLCEDDSAEPGAEACT